MTGVGQLVGEGDNRAVTEIGFSSVTTKTWAYLGVFGFIRFFFVINNVHPKGSKKNILSRVLFFKL